MLVDVLLFVIVVVDVLRCCIVIKRVCIVLLCVCFPLLCCECFVGDICWVVLGSSEGVSSSE